MKEVVRRCDPRRRSYWEEVVRRWKEGGRSVREYCRAEGLRESAFYFWRRQLAQRNQIAAAGIEPRPKVSEVAPARRSPKRSSSPRRAPASFLPVQVVAPARECPDTAETAQGVEILVEGRTLRIRPGFDRQTLADVLAVLESRPC